MQQRRIIGLRLTFPAAPTVLAHKAPELDRPRLVLVQLQAESGQSLGGRALEALGIPQVLNAGISPAALFDRFSGTSQ
ncbi:hypothetical protein FPJ27_15510 [Burkholderia sp. MS455]|uniref:hypothetical protein n=1 Tax=Burkholderia sp. MS455 TaxID=2811788 RepID=UPI00195B8DAC|nr:hypothetical protein [Burkholderia sp. MS455]QRR07669.1 hypothetical protein FPJ27_15510 [Burkholderia sp. MS455]